MNLVTTENIQVVQYSCLPWFSESVTRAVLAISLIACFEALPRSQTLAQDIQVDAELELKTGRQDGVLTVTAEIPDGYHTYSLTQPAGGPTRSTLKLNGTGIQLIGDFVAQQEPEKHDDEFLGPVEELRGMVSWHAQVQVSPDVEPAKLKAKVEMYAQICTDTTQMCKPPTTYSGEIEFLGERADLEFPGIPKQIELPPFQPAGSHVLLTGSVFTDDGTQNFKPGDTVTMEITAVPLEAFHVYAYQTTTQQTHTPTMISIKRPAGWAITGPTVSVDPTLEHELPIHDAPTSWRFKIKIPKTAVSDQAIPLTGGIQTQTCTEIGCDAPKDSRFTVTIPMGTDSAVALNFESAPYGSIAKAIRNGDFAEPISEGSPASKPPTPKPKTQPANEFVETDTPEQIAAMAGLYDVDEPIKFINFSEMDQFPIASASDSASMGKTSLLIFLLFAFIGGAITSWMLFVFSGGGNQPQGAAEQDGSLPAYPRMRRFAFVAAWVFSICILGVGGLLITGTEPWTSNNRNQASTETTNNQITWANWYPGKVVQQLKQNKIVWVNYTADWNPTCKLNEARLASNDKLVKRMNEMEISFVAVDFTQKDDNLWKELKRTDSRILPVHLIYPPNYPAEPAIQLEVIFSPADVHLVLDRMEAITAQLKE